MTQLPINHTKKVKMVQLEGKQQQSEKLAGFCQASTPA